MIAPYVLLAFIGTSTHAPSDMSLGEQWGLSREFLDDIRRNADPPDYAGNCYDDMVTRFVGGHAIKVYNPGCVSAVDAMYRKNYVLIENRAIEDSMNLLRKEFDICVDSGKGRAGCCPLLMAYYWPDRWLAPVAECGQWKDSQGRIHG